VVLEAGEANRLKGWLNAVPPGFEKKPGRKIIIRSEVMKKLLSLLMGAALLMAVQSVRADDMGMKGGMSTSVANTTPVAKVKAKKAKKKASKAAAQELWVCAMGDYIGPKTTDGKCPKCGMDLMKKK
jgi:uncharacterized paraquat-inducible protein A